jgi:type II secretory pathway component PulK
MASLLLQRLADDEDLLIDHAGETWARAEQLDYPGGIRVRGRVVDLNRRFDLNNLALTAPGGGIREPVAVLTDLFAEARVSETATRVAALKDWIDEDGEGTWETAFYSRRPVPMDCPDAVLLSLDEVRHVHGFATFPFLGPDNKESPAADLDELIAAIPVKRLRPVTVNVNTAPRNVLTALLGNERLDLVDFLLDLRVSAPLRSVDDLVRWIGRDQLGRVRAYLDVKSNYFSVEVFAGRPGAVPEQVSAMVRRESDGSVHVVRWAG